jgi:tRNA pseudouridine38-40 synthase
VTTIRIDLAYDGTNFHGYARNPGVRTVQGALEDALSQVLGRPVETSVAGRTDAGVHARHQVVSFAAAEAIDLDKLARSLASMIGPEVAISAITEAPAGFHARFSARRRRYRYFVDEAPVTDPLRRHSVWHVGEELDLAAMNQVAECFVGEHDFASLCRPAPGKTTVRTVLTAAWSRQDGLVVYEVTGSAFCHQMVRSMVILCVLAGRNKLDPAEVPTILESRDRNAARGAAPPHGLVLWEVSF